MDIGNYILPLLSASILAILVFIEDVYISKREKQSLKQYAKLFIISFLSVFLSSLIFSKYTTLTNMVKVKNVFTGEPNF
jgi:ABC-type iron transport system FetAB permease component